MTELRNNGTTEGQTGQIQYSPHFFKAGLYNPNLDIINVNVYTKFD